MRAAIYIVVSNLKCCSHQPAILLKLVYIYAGRKKEATVNVNIQTGSLYRVVIDTV